VRVSYATVASDVVGVGGRDVEEFSEILVSVSLSFSRELFIVCSRLIMSLIETVTDSQSFWNLTESSGAVVLLITASFDKIGDGCCGMSDNNF